MTRLVGTYARPNVSGAASYVPSTVGQEAFSLAGKAELIANSNLESQSKDNVFDQNVTISRYNLPAGFGAWDTIVGDTGSTSTFAINDAGANAFSTNPGSSGAIYKTTDRGVSWTQVYASNVVPERSNGFIKIVDSAIFAQIGSANYTTTTSNRLISYGTSTVTLTSGQNINYQAIAKFGGRYLVAGTNLQPTTANLIKISTGTSTAATGWTTYQIFTSTTSNSVFGGMVQHNSKLCIIESQSRGGSAANVIRAAYTTSGVNQASWTEAATGISDIKQVMVCGLGYIDGVEKILICGLGGPNATYQRSLIYYNSDTTLTSWTKYFEGNTNYTEEGNVLDDNVLNANNNGHSRIINIGTKTFILFWPQISGSDNYGLFNMQTKSTTMFAAPGARYFEQSVSMRQTETDTIGQIYRWADMSTETKLFFGVGTIGPNDSPSYADISELEHA